MSLAFHFLQDTVRKIFKIPQVILLLIALFIILNIQITLYFKLQFYGTDFSSGKRLVFPKSFQADDLHKFMDVYPNAINLKTEWSQIAIMKHANKLSFLRDIKYSNHKLNVFHSSDNIADLNECNKLQERFTVGISDIKDLKVQLSSILGQFVLDSRNNSYYQEILPYFGDKVMELIENKMIDKHFFS